MTVDPFGKHLRSVRLLRLSSEILGKNKNGEIKSLVMTEGKVVNAINHEGLFTELLVNDSLADLVVPVITFDINTAFKINEKIACFGFVHYDWLPDYRCTDLKPFKSALKAEIIKRS